MYAFLLPRLSRQGSYVLGRKLRTDHNIHWYRALRALPFSEAEDDEVFGERQRDVDLEAPPAGFAGDTQARRQVTLCDTCWGFLVRAYLINWRGASRRDQST